MNVDSISSLPLDKPHSRQDPNLSVVPKYPPFGAGSSATTDPEHQECLPRVECIVRARIPTTSGAETFLHLYQNDADTAEHLAIVFGNEIRSRSLDRVRENETEMDRMIRGAYTGRLRPGRTSSVFDDRPRTEVAIEKLKGATTTSTLCTASAVSDDRSPRARYMDYPRTQENLGSRLAQKAQTPHLVRVHSECYTGETTWSARCHCGQYLDEAARMMSDPADGGGGVIVYLRHDVGAIGLGNKLTAYNLQDLGSDTVETNSLLRQPADARIYNLAIAILLDLGCGGERGIRLLTNDPGEMRVIEGRNGEIRVKETVPLRDLA